MRGTTTYATTTRMSMRHGTYISQPNYWNGGNERPKRQTALPTSQLYTLSILFRSEKIDAKRDTCFKGSERASIFIRIFHLAYDPGMKLFRPNISTVRIKNGMQKQFGPCQPRPSSFFIRGPSQK